MAATGLEVFDKTLHTTNQWLDEICAEIGPDKHLAWHVLGAVLRSIRDELLIGQSAHLAAQLPLLVRGPISINTGRRRSRSRNARKRSSSREFAMSSPVRGRSGRTSPPLR